MARVGKDIALGPPGPGKGPESRPEKGRRCADPGCTTVLSTYNASPTCYLHTMPVRRHALER